MLRKSAKAGETCGTVRPGSTVSVLLCVRPIGGGGGRGWGPFVTPRGPAPFFPGGSVPRARVGLGVGDFFSRRIGSILERKHHVEESGRRFGALRRPFPGAMRPAVGAAKP